MTFLLVLFVGTMYTEEILYHIGIIDNYVIFLFLARPCRPMDGIMDGWMDGWMHLCIHVFMYVSRPLYIGLSVICVCIHSYCVRLVRRDDMSPCQDMKNINAVPFIEVQSHGINYLLTKEIYHCTPILSMLKS